MRIFPFVSPFFQEASFMLSVFTLPNVSFWTCEAKRPVPVRCNRKVDVTALFHLHVKFKKVSLRGGMG
jgi:hypothetical protein